MNPEDKTYNATIEFNDKKTRLRASMLVIKDDEILLGKEDGYLSIPGGGLEPDESVVDAGIRETQEEVYINVKKAQDT